MPFDIEDVRTRLEGLVVAEPARLRRRVAALARPRMSGSRAAVDVERELEARFDDLGYEAERFPFSFSSWPGRYGLSVAGGLLAVAGAAGAALILAGLPGAALSALVLGMAGALAPLLLLGPALDRLPYGRIQTRNHLFRRPGSRPAWVLMAHRDTKSQRIPTLIRSAAIGAAAVAWIVLVVLGLVWYGGDPFRSTTLTAGAGILLFLAGAVLALSWSADRSPGALDNATGLAALLEVAEDNHTGDVAFLITDGEELGLAGARAVARLLPPVQGVINVDGLDDHGTFYVAEGYGWRRQGSAPQLAAALLTAGAALDLPVSRRPLPRTTPVDHLPIAEAGVPAVTLLRGDWRSLLRVHRPADRADRIDGGGAAAGATLLRAAMRILRDSEPGHLAARGTTGS
jgi:hypothetical protein